MTLLSFLLACSDPTVAPGAASQPVQPAEQAQGTQGVQGTFQPDTPPTQAIPAEPPAGHNARIPLLGRRPSEAERGEATIWLRGSVPGLTSGQVRFHAPDGDKLKVICLGEVVNGRYEAEAPPHSPDPVYVSVVALPDDEAVEASHAWGALEAPLTLAGKDLVADLTLGAKATWTDRTDPPIDRIVLVEQVNSGP